VVKSYRRKRIVGVKQRVIFGPAATIESILAKRGWKINTSLIERLNLDFRQHVAAIGRRVNTLCKHEAGLRQQLALFHTYHNFVLPHASLRVPPPALEVISETGSIKRWQPRTPAMAAGLTNHMWSLRAVLMYRVPRGRRARWVKDFAWLTMVKSSAESVSKMPCHVNRGGENPIEDRMSRFN
jgi:hypothetical protein